MVPPRGRIPLTSLSVSSKDFSGQMRPSKPSGMPMTFHPYLMMAALVAARMTALRPGASPPPVLMPMQRISDMRLVVSRCLLVVACWSWAGAGGSRFYDDTGACEDGNLRVGVSVRVPRSHHEVEPGGVSERVEILISRQEGDSTVDTSLSDQGIAEPSFVAHRQYLRPEQAGALPITRLDLNHRNFCERFGDS